MVVTVLSAPSTGAAPGASAISQSWFGAIQTGYQQASGFEAAAEDIGVGLLRWPGGSLSETRPEVYGLDIPGLFDATDLWAHDPDRYRPDLTESMAYANAHGMDYALILPTERYHNDLATGEAHLSAFLADLFQGVYGDLPQHLTLEIGNEYYTLDAFEDDPAAYGAIASRFSELIAQAAELYLSEAEFADIDIAVQMGFNSAENTAIMNAFSSEALAATSSLVFHSLPISLNNLNKLHDERDGLTRYDSASQNFQAWQAAIQAAGGTADPALFLSAWSVGGSGGSAETVNLTYHEYGSRSLSVLLESFAGYSSIGVDAAAVWGVNVDKLNQVSTPDGSNSELTHMGELLKLMAASLPGLTLLDEFALHDRDDETMLFTYGDDTQIVSYVAINELGNENGSVTLEFEGVANFRLDRATLISSALEDGYEGTLGSEAASIYEVPVVGGLGVLFADTGLQFDFVESFDVAEIVVTQGDGFTGTDGQDWITGALSADDISGGQGNDFLQGGAGGDTVEGGEGSDQIFGGDGGDLLFGEGALDGIDLEVLADYFQF